MLPCIQKKIEACLSNDNTIEDMRDRLNRCSGYYNQCKIEEKH